MTARDEAAWRQRASHDFEAALDAISMGTECFFCRHTATTHEFVTRYAPDEGPYAAADGWTLVVARPGDGGDRSADARMLARYSAVRSLQMKRSGQRELAQLARLELAQLLMADDQSQAAVDELLLIIRKTVRAKNDATATQAGTDAKEYLLKLFDVLGVDDAVSKGGRRRLANILLV